MSKYLITLKPTGKFFFGGEMTFQVGDNEKDEFNQQFASYIIESSKFPQQTSLLGMLRFILLRKSDLFDLNDNKIKNHHDTRLSELIGESSFMIDKEGGYGKIQRIYPCFLMRGKDKVIILPKDSGSEKGKFGIKRIVFSEKAYRYNDRIIGIEKIIRHRKDNDKEEEPTWITKDGLNTWYWDGKELLKEDNIFVEDRRIGINRIIETGKTQDNALFKQVNYRLTDGYCFAFYADIDNIDISLYKDEIVSVGADSSQFKLGIEGPIKDDDVITTAIPTGYQPQLVGAYGKIVLDSPSFITDDVLSKACFSITETIPFKFMKTTIKTEDYSRLGRKIRHSDRYELYQMGSVFYFRTKEDMKGFKTGIEERTDFRTIGYNYMTEIIEKEQ